MPRLLRSCALLLVFAALCSPCQGTEVVVFEAGRTVPVVIPAPGDDVAQAAAQALQRYLKLMTGADVSILAAKAEAPAGCVPIYLSRLGQGVGSARPEGLPALESDGFDIVVTRRGCTVHGANEAGLWHGMYALLEDLGCRFYFPSDLGENIPSVQGLSLASGARTENPSFVHRNMWWAYSGRPPWQRALYADWQKKAKMGGVSASMGHNLRRIVPPAPYKDSHPEYFPLWDGERHIPAPGEGHGWQPCTSNPEVVQLAIAAAIKYFDEHPGAYSFSLSPNDGYGWCECDACVAQDPPEYRAQAKRGKARRTLLFANQVAKALAEKHPNKYVAWYAYAGTVEPPTDIRAHPNVVTAVAHYGRCGCNVHPIESTSCTANAAFRQIMQGWAAVADKLFVREYFTTLAPSADLLAQVVGAYSLAEDMSYFKSHNVIGVNSESIPDYGSAALNFYLAGKLMWNAAEDVEALKQDWHKGMYGPAGDAMRIYTDTIVEAVRARGCRGPYMDEELVERLRGLLDRAAGLAQTAKQKARIAMTREALQYMLLMRQYTLKPSKETLERLKVMIADIEEHRRLSVDFVRHKSVIGRRSAVSPMDAARYARLRLRPASEEPVPDEAVQAAFTTRGQHGHAALLEQGERLRATVEVRRLGRYLNATSWAVIDAQGKPVLEGVASVGEASSVDYVAPAAGTYAIATNSGANACRVKAENAHCCLVGTDVHFLGATPWWYFALTPDAERVGLSLRTDAPGETGRLVIKNPAGDVVFDEETGPRKSKVTFDAAVPPALRGTLWSAQVTRASTGACEDLMLRLGAGVVPCLATHPARLLLPVEP